MSTAILAPSPFAVNYDPATVFPRLVQPDEFVPSPADVEELATYFGQDVSPWWAEMEAEADQLELSARGDEAVRELRYEAAEAGVLFSDDTGSPFYL